MTLNIKPPFKIEATIQIMLWTHNCRCTSCGRNWQHCDLLFRTRQNSFSYTITPEREKMLRNNPKLVKHKRSTETIMPVCFSCVKTENITQTGWTTWEASKPTEPAKAKTQAKTFTKAITNLLD